MIRSDRLPPILPVGTQVVTLSEVSRPNANLIRPEGSVGVIVQSPGETEGFYRVRFLDGGEASLRRDELEARKHYQRGELDSSESPVADLYPYVIYRCVVGSRAYGLDEPGSDTDRRGIYLPPAELHWSLFGVPEQLENDETQEAYWEIQKFLILALKANPNVLECLYSPLIEMATPLAEELLAMREAFLSRLVYQTYNGYVLSQFKKLEGDLRNRGSIRWKHAMHLIRLLLSGITVLQEGRVPVRVEDADRERLLSIRQGDLPWEEINAWRLKLHETFEAAFARTTLPERPDYRAANDFLIKARRSRVEFDPSQEIPPWNP